MDQTPQASLKKIALNYGLALAFISIIISVILYVTGNHLENPWWASLLRLVVAVTITLYGLKAFKMGSGGYMSLGQALKTGMAIALISGLVGAIFQYLFMTVIEPDFVNQMMEVTREKMLEQNPNMTEEQMKFGLDMSRKFMQPGIMSAIIIVSSLFFGFIISLILGLILKQNRPEH